MLNYVVLGTKLIIKESYKCIIFCKFKKSCLGLQRLKTLYGWCIPLCKILSYLFFFHIILLFCVYFYFHKDENYLINFS